MTKKIFGETEFFIFPHCAHAMDPFIVLVMVIVCQVFYVKMYEHLHFVKNLLF